MKLCMCDCDVGCGGVGVHYACGREPGRVSVLLQHALVN